MKPRFQQSKWKLNPIVGAQNIDRIVLKSQYPNPLFIIYKGMKKMIMINAVFTTPYWLLLYMPGYVMSEVTGNVENVKNSGEIEFSWYDIDMMHNWIKRVWFYNDCLPLVLLTISVFKIGSKNLFSTIHFRICFTLP